MGDQVEAEMEAIVVMEVIVVVMEIMAIVDQSLANKDTIDFHQ